MTDRELNITLREMAREKGLCDEWYGRWSDDDTIDMCLDRAVRGLDFVIDRDFPPLDFIRENFRREDLRRYRIYVDEDIDIRTSEGGTYIFLGKCTGRLVVDGLRVVTVYAAHDSDVSVEARGGSRVFVTAYGTAKSSVTGDIYSKFYSYRR